MLALFLCEDSPINVLYLECVSGSRKSMRRSNFIFRLEAVMENLVEAHPHPPQTKNFFQFNYMDLRVSLENPKSFPVAKTFYLKSEFGFAQPSSSMPRRKFSTRLWRLERINKYFKKQLPSGDNIQKMYNRRDPRRCQEEGLGREMYERD